MKLTAFCIIVAVFFAIVYFLGADAMGESNSAAIDTASRTDDKQPIEGKPADKSVIVPYEAKFLKVTEKCVRCHKNQFSSTDNLKTIKWVVPGKPDASPIYKVIGKNKSTNGTYHNLTDAEKATINDYIKNLK
jgi:hypothetical protein